MGATVAIIGYGHVGEAMNEIFPDSIKYDKYKGDISATQSEVSQCDLGIICVPTPIDDTGACDVSAVQEVVSWLQTPLILIKSTVIPGTTDTLKQQYQKRVTVSPEYFGESSYYLPDSVFSPLGWPYLIVGGSREDTSAVIDIFLPRLGPTKQYLQTNARTAELVKYMENVWLAMQVTFANELFEIATRLQIDYMELRELWALDPRVSKYHTLVFQGNRGFGGKCLPKDLEALIAASQASGYEPNFLKEILLTNSRFRDTENLLGLPS